MLPEPSVAACVIATWEDLASLCHRWLVQTVAQAQMPHACYSLLSCKKVLLLALKRHAAGAGIPAGAKLLQEVVQLLLACQC
jgi:hypothetical protein